MLGQAINDWWPCNHPPCDDHPDVGFSITVAQHAQLMAPSELVGLAVSNGETEQEYIELKWADANGFEDGWIIERREDTGSVWDTVRTLGPNYDDTVAVWDTAFVGSETYVYRVAPWIQNNQGPYSPELSIRARPHWPSDYNGGVLIYYPWISLMSVPEGAVANSNVTDGDDGGSGGVLSNAVRIGWVPPVNQAMPIDHYRVRVTKSYSPWLHDFYETTETFIQICSLEAQTFMFFDLQAIDTGGVYSGWNWDRSGLVTGSFDICGGGPLPMQRKEAVLPRTTVLKDCYPNPFNMSTIIAFDLAKPSEMVLEVFNVLGRKVKTLRSGMENAGSYEVMWSGDGESGKTVSTGVYFVRFHAGDYSATKKIALVK